MMESEGGYTLNDVNPCPFCGNYALLKGAPQFGYFVSCQTIGCYANATSAKHHDWQAVEAWNRRATHPQPVTPAGGEVEPVAEVSFTLDGRPAICSVYWDRLKYGDKLYTNPPAADAALVRDAERYRWWRENIDLLDQQSMIGIAYSCQIPVHNGHVPTAELMDMIADSQDAALNQRGG